MRAPLVFTRFLKCSELRSWAQRPPTLILLPWHFPICLFLLPRGEPGISGAWDRHFVKPNLGFREHPRTTQTPLRSGTTAEYTAPHYLQQRRIPGIACLELEASCDPTFPPWTVHISLQGNLKLPNAEMQVVTLQLQGSGCHGHIFQHSRKSR